MSLEESARKSIEIPTRDGSEVIEVYLDELPEEVEEIAEILYSEAAPIELYHQFALEYFKRSFKESFVALIKRGISEAKRKNSNDANRQLGRLYSTLAAHYINEGLQCPAGDRRKASEYLEEATSCLNEAEQRSYSSFDDFGVRKGLLLLAKNTVEAAGYQFKFCLDKASDSIPSQLGQAVVQFSSGNFRAALSGFQGILRQFPQFNEIRSAIGYCFQRLGFEDLAIKAFSRVLELDPQNEEAQQALAFLQLGSQDPSVLQRGLIRFKAIYEADRSNSLAQIHLANHFFFKKDLTKAKTLAEGALSSATTDRLKAEAHFVLAKIAQSSNNFPSALTNYQLASKFAVDFAPALFGLGQCFLARNDLENAALMFEKVLGMNPTCSEALRLIVLISLAKLVKLHVSERTPEQLERVRSHLDQTLAVYPNDVILLQGAAVIFEDIDHRRSLKFYEKMIELNNGNIAAAFNNNFALFNNFSVLRHSAGLIDAQTADCLKKALELKLNETAIRSGPSDAFIKFNYARVLEDVPNHCNDDAETKYREVLLEMPSLIACHLRMGIRRLKSGQLAEAADHFKDALGEDDQSRDAWNCLAATHLRQKAFTPARKAFERLLQSIDKHDAFALVGLGNIYVDLARHSKSSGSREEYYKRAGEFFLKALSVEKGNVFAAQGLGIILAEQGSLFDAKEAFTQVRLALLENGASSHSYYRAGIGLTDSTLNLAHVFTELGQCPGAVSLYRNLLDEGALVGSAGKQVSLHLFLSRALYLATRENPGTEWSQQIDEAIGEVRKALQLLPQDIPLKFNLALLLQHRASLILKLPVDIEPEFFSSAQDNLSEAEELFDQINLVVNDNTATGSIDPKLLHGRKEQCQAIKEALNDRAVLNQAQSQTQAQRLTHFKEQRALRLLKEEEAQAREAQVQQARSTEIELARRELAAKMKATEEKVKAAAYTSKPRETRASQDSDDDGSVNEGGNEDGETSARKPRRQRQESLKKALKRAHRSDASDAEEEVDGVVRSRTRRKRATSESSASAAALSKEFISDSDDEAALDNETLEQIHEESD